MVPSCSTISARDMPMPLSVTVRVPCLGVVVDADRELGSSASSSGSRSASKRSLSAGVGRVGDQLAEKNLPVAVEGMDHQLEELFDLGLKAAGLAIDDGVHVILAAA